MRQQARLHYSGQGRFGSSSRSYSAISTRALHATQQADAALSLDASWGCDFLGFPTSSQAYQPQPRPDDRLAI
jgi:hypothetical protein